MIVSRTELPRKRTVADPAGCLRSSGAWVPVSCRARGDGFFEVWTIKSTNINHACSQMEGSKFISEGSKFMSDF
jgi:hypothetical protein